MTIEELTPLLDAYGLLEDSTRVVGRPRLSGEQMRVVARMKKRYAKELANVKEARIEALNLTRFVDRRRVIQSLVEESQHAPALLLTFNDAQLVLLWAWRDLLGGEVSA